MNQLRLPLIAKWFKITSDKIKTEDYREITPYWVKRLFKYPDIFYVLNDCCIECKHRVNIDNIPACSFDRKHITSCNKNKFQWNDSYFKHFDINTMTLGYPKSTDTSRILKLEHKGIEIRTGNPEWGAEPNKLYFVIKHGEIIE